MFATLIGPFSAAGAESGSSAAEDLAALGLEPVGDGFGARVADAAAGPGIVAAWQTAAASTRSAVKASLLGPFSTARLRGGNAIAWGEAVGAVAADLAAA